MRQRQLSTVYTVGHGSRSRNEFIDLLASNKVRVLVDVRRFPRSKTEHFNKENLRVLLATASISYECMGETLGGFREGGYERHMQTKIFTRCLEG